MYNIYGIYECVYPVLGCLCLLLTLNWTKIMGAHPALEPIDGVIDFPPG